MTENEKLKPCPFCGHEVEMRAYSENEWLVICPACKVERWRETEAEAIEQWNRRTNKGSVDKVDLEKAIDIIKTVSAEYNNGWIPCSERMPNPEESKNIMFTCGRDYEMGGYRWMADDATAFYSRNNSCYVDRKVVIAWQPLPQPYEPMEGES